MSGESFAAALRHAGGLCRCRDRHEGRATEHLAAEAGEGGAVSSASGKPFAFPGTQRVYERDRPFEIEHLAIDLALDVPAKAVEGQTTIRARRIDAAAEWLRLDAIAFSIRSIEIDGRPARFTYDDATIAIAIPRDRDRFEIAIGYRAVPKRGLYFLEPDEHVRDRPRQVWSQCQDEDARHWIPCHDKPHVKQTTEMRVRVPAGWTALSNGALVSREGSREGETFHWKQARPHPTYLITLVAGEFAELVEEGTKLPITYLVPKGREADGWRTFRRTPAMIALFEEKTGVPFPWEKYAQVVVADFIFGGMENTSATTMYEHIMLDARAALDVEMDGLVAHELAHQWFGDYVTCRDWSEGWLNEGWATYMELVWRDEGRAVGDDLPWEGYGRDEYDYALKGELDIYLMEDAGRYRRPIVCRDYEQPIDLFDRHLYQKGALVLHAIRRLVGDEPFWRGVRSYLAAHAFGSVETRDFQRALEAASGRSLDRIFDLYVHGAGHPEFEVVVDHEPGSAHVVVSIKQTQKHEDPTRLYRGPLVIEIVEGGGARRETLEIRAARDAFVLSVRGRPEQVVVDPDGDLLATFDLKVPSDLLRAQLRRGSSARVRWTAAIALGRRDEPATITALADALADDGEFWGVRAEAAEALGAIKGEAAFAALRTHVALKNPRIRRAVARALGKFRRGDAVELLRPIALADDSYLVQSDAARALGSTRQAAAYETLVELLDRKAWADCVRSGAAEGLASLRDERAIPHLTARTAYGHEGPGRRACLLSLAKLDTSRKTRELLEDRLDDVDVFVRISAVRGLEILGDPKARSALAARLEKEDAGPARRRIREALRDLAGSRQDEVRKLRDEIEKLRDDGHELRLRLAKLESKLGEQTPEPTERPRAAAAKTPTKKGKSPKTVAAKGKKPKGLGRAAAAALDRTPFRSGR
jgi:aminopeptidase N